MFNLIRRDAILQKRQLYVFIPFILFFAFMDSHPALIFLVASIFIPFNTYAYDEKAETNILLNSLPYTRKEIIASRYLGALVYMCVSVVLVSLALFILGNSFSFADIAIGSGLFLLFSAFTFPIFYIFKPGYLSIVVLGTFLISAIAGPTILKMVTERMPEIMRFLSELSVPALYMGGALVILVIYCLSWGVSTKIYERKAF